MISALLVGCGIFGGSLACGAIFYILLADALK